MELNVQLPVHRVALSGVEVPAPEHDAPVLYASLIIWADLTALRQSGFELGYDNGLLPTLRTVSAVALMRQTHTSVSVSPFHAQAVVDENGTVTSFLHPEADPNDPMFTLTLPTAALALATALVSTPLIFRLILVDGKPPRNPEFTSIPVEAISATIEVDPNAVHGALHGRVPHQLHVPLNVFANNDDDDVSPAVENIRRLLWPVVSGFSLSQTASWNRLSGIAEWAHALGLAPSLSDGDAERLEAIFEVGMQTLDASKHDLTGHTAMSDVTLSDLPPRLYGLRKLIQSSLNPEVYDALAAGQPFPMVVQEFGFPAVLPAFAVLVAARAACISALPEHEGISPAWIIGTWMSGDDEALAWTMVASGPMLAHHDVEVIVDVLAVTDEDEAPNELLHAYLHTLVETLHTVNLDHDDLRLSLAASEIKPDNFTDTVALAETLVREAEESHKKNSKECSACAAVNEMMEQSGWEIPRLARSAATLLPILADMDANSNGFGVGEPEWVEHRNEFLAHWLNTIAA